MKHFDLTKKNNLLETKYFHYGKITGLLFAHKLNLPVSTSGWICSSITDSIDLPDFQNKYLCRPDAPKGMGNQLPRGKDLMAVEIIPFMKEIKKISEDGIILIFRHPTLELFGQYIPRYQSFGGATVIIDKKKDVTIEFVGPGFDVGDLTRGKAVHTNVVIPINEIFIKVSRLYRYNFKNIIGTRFDIPEKQYRHSRKERIAELKLRLGESQNIDKFIPINPTYLSLRMFKSILLTCIEPVIFSNDPRLNNIFGIMMNIYRNKLHVFEIWSPERNIGNFI
jgi:hypothetical protein